MDAPLNEPRLSFADQTLTARLSLRGEEWWQIQYADITKRLTASKTKAKGKAKK